jgi:ubiquinone/menaquinone biosynthesis C-methylase UbiE
MTTEQNKNEIHELVKSQFGATASAYTVSNSHTDQVSLDLVVNLAQPKATDVAIDIATGAGHTAMAVAPYVAQMIAYDITPEMLEETAKNAAERGLSNLSTKLGAAEKLPFEDNTFDIVTVRTAPHHYADIKKSVLEMARVVKPGGRVVVMDTTVPEDETLDKEINYIEMRRDPSHVRNYSSSEWQTMLVEAGLQIYYNKTDYFSEQGTLNFKNWTGRMRTPADVVAELDGLFRNASSALKEALKIRLENNEIIFNLPKITIAATK